MSRFEYPIYPILALIASILVITPLPWHLQAWNTGTFILMVWLFFGCLNYAVNAIVWHTDVVDRAPIWCDISSRIIVAIEAAVPAASLCITHRLYKIASARVDSDTKSVRKHRDRIALLVDFAVGLGIPIWQLATALIVSGHRYDIYEQVGCYPFIPNTALAFPLVLIWPILVALCSVIYCGLALLSAYTQREQFVDNLTTNSSLTIHRYFCLLSLAIAVLLCTTSVAVYNIISNAASTPYPWSDVVVMGLSRVDQYPALLWTEDRSSVISFELNRWSVVLCAIVAFAFLGFDEEARERYRNLLASILDLGRRVRPGAQFPSNEKGGPQIISIGSLPVYYAYTPSLSLKEKEKGDRPPRLHLDFDFESDVSSSLATPRTAHTETFRSSVTFRGIGHAL